MVQSQLACTNKKTPREIQVVVSSLVVLMWGQKTCCNVMQRRKHRHKHWRKQSVNVLKQQVLHYTLLEYWPVLERHLEEEGEGGEEGIQQQLWKMEKMRTIYLLHIFKTSQLSQENNSFKVTVTLGSMHVRRGFLASTNRHTP